MSRVHEMHRVLLDKAASLRKGLIGVGSPGFSETPAVLVRDSSDSVGDG
jgi:hypothetical protein